MRGAVTSSILSVSRAPELFLLFRRGVLLISVGFALAGSAFSAPATAESGRAARAFSCPSDEESAFFEIACEITEGLGKVPDKVLVVAAKAQSDRSFSDANGLSMALVAHVAKRLGAGARAHGEPASPAGARAREQDADELIHLVPQIREGTLRVYARTYSVHRSFWDRVRFSSLEATGRAEGARRIDAQVTSFLKPLSPADPRVEKVRRPPGNIVALACGDADGDGTLELAVVTRSKVSLGRLREGRYIAHAETEWARVADVAPSPLREPIATATIVPSRYVEVGLTDRAAAARFLPDLSRPQRLAAAVPLRFAGCFSAAGTELGALRPCVEGEPHFPVDAKGIDALASARIVAKTGAAFTVFALREPDGTVRLRDSAGRSAAIASAGAQLAVGDLDLDGTPEIVSSENTLLPDQDALVVRSWGTDGTLVERFRVPVPSGVQALAVCPPEGRRGAAVAAAPGDGLWIVR